MKKREVISTLIVVVIVVLVIGAIAFLWFWNPFRKTEEFEYSDFTGVEVRDAFRVEITQSSSYSVTITAGDIFEHIQVSKTGDTLEVKMKNGVYPGPVGSWSAKITMPDLYELKLSAATHGTIEGFNSSHKLVLDISGASTLDASDISAGEIEINIEAERGPRFASKISGSITAGGDAQFTVSGGSKVELEGGANDLLVSAEGASDVELSDFPVHNANVTLSEASQATINLDGRLDADVSGGSHLYYIGDPTMGDIQKSGDSEISKK